MAYFPPTGSTVAFQSDATKLVGTVSIVGTIPFNNSSVLAKLINSSVTAYQGVTPWVTTGSVQGTMSVIGTVPVTQATDPWKVQLTSGSIATTVTTGNSSVQVVGLMPPQSVSGVGLFNVNHTGNGSVQAVLLNSSVTALQGTNPWMVQLTSGSVITTGGNSSVQVVGTMPPQSVSGVGLFNVNHTGNGSIVAVIPGSIAVAIVSGSVAVSVTPPANQSVSGEVNVVQTTNPWVVQLTSGSIATTVNTGNSSVQVVGLMPAQSVSGVGLFNVNHTGNGSILTVSLGSIATAPYPASVSGVGTFNIDPQGAGSIIAKLINSSVTAYQGVTPWVVQTTGSVLNQYREDTAATSVVGVAMIYRRDDSTSMLGVVSPANPLPVKGSVMALQGTNPWQMTGSVAVMSVAPHSVAALQGTNPWAIGNSSVQVVGTMPAQSVSGVGLFNVNHTGNGSVIALSVGSVAAAQIGIWAVSVVGGPLNIGSIQGTYLEDTAHTDGHPGLFVLGVRNDAVASFASANLDYAPHAVDSSGRVITKPYAPVESSFVATASTVNSGFGTNQAASVRVLAAPGAGLKWYVTDLNVSNTGSVSALVSLTDDASLVLWKGIAPAGGGNNMPGLVTPIVSATANTPLGIVSGTASSIIHIWVAGYKAP